MLLETGIPSSIIFATNNPLQPEPDRIRIGLNPGTMWFSSRRGSEEIAEDTDNEYSVGDESIRMRMKSTFNGSGGRMLVLVEN